MRNERYWRGAPYLDSIVTRVLVGQTELVDLLKNGEVDIGQEIKPQYLNELEEQPDLQIWKFLDDEYDFLALQLGDPADPQPGLNEDRTVRDEPGQHPILGDRRVRQAIGYALDRSELIARARFGQGIPLYANVLPTVSWAYNTDLEPPETDLERAASLLDEAGWVLNTTRGIRQKDGVALRLELATNSGNAVRERMAALIAEQLAEVGIEVEVVATTWDSFRDVLYGQTFDMALVNWSNLGVNPDDTQLWHTSSDVPGTGANFCSYRNPQVEEMLTLAREAPGCDQDVRADLYRQIQAQLVEDQPYVWIDVPRNLVAINARLGGLNTGPWDLWHDVHRWYAMY